MKINFISNAFIFVFLIIFLFFIFIKLPLKPFNYIEYVLAETKTDHMNRESFVSGPLFSSISQELNIRQIESINLNNNALDHLILYIKLANYGKIAYGYNLEFKIKLNNYLYSTIISTESIIDNKFHKIYLKKIRRIHNHDQLLIINPINVNQNFPLTCWLTPIKNYNRAFMNNKYLDGSLTFELRGRYKNTYLYSIIGFILLLTMIIPIYCLLKLK